MVAESQFTFADRLKACRARAARRRSDAFVDYAPVVCGLTLRPVTLASYNRLTAFESPFVTGGPLSVHAVCVWVWAHHPEFAQGATEARNRVFRAVVAATVPRFPCINGVLIAARNYPRWRWLSRFAKPTAVENLAREIAEIRRIMAEAMAGFPAIADDPHAIEPDDDGAPASKAPQFDAGVSVAFQAQILNTFCRNYRMSYAETEALPMKRLGQLWREHLYFIGGDKTGLRMMDREEAELWKSQLTEGASNV